MATIEKRGEHTYRIRVDAGTDSNGIRIRKYKNVELDPGLSQKQIDKEIERQKFEFEKQVKHGSAIDEI